MAISFGDKMEILIALLNDIDTNDLLDCARAKMAYNGCDCENCINLSEEEKRIQQACMINEGIMLVKVFELKNCITAGIDLTNHKAINEN